jgi:NADH-quinone oxidoreductase subunit M
MYSNLTQFPILTLLIFLPVLFAVIVAFLPKENAKGIQATAFVGTLFTLALSIVIWTLYHAHGAQFQLVDVIYNWIPGLHVNYLVGMDGISLLLVLMTTGIWPFVIGVSFREIKERQKAFYAWALLMETAILGVFLSLNLVLFYVFWEAMLIPMYFIMGIWGGPNRVYATLKFFLYTMVGSMVMLVSIIYLYIASGSRTFDFPILQAMVQNHTLVFPATTAMLLFIGFFLAFGIKAPMWPFHTWVPDAYAEAPTGGTIMLVALKMGLYGFIRFCLPLFPNAVHYAAPVIITLSVIGVIYAALVAAMQTDLKRLLAYSSVSHIGVIMLAIFGLTTIGLSGAVIQMVSHTITTGALFILVGALYARRGSYKIADYGGLMAVMPAFTVVFLIATLSSVALPLTSGFTGEFLMLLGAFQTHPWAAGFATTAAVWSVVYMLWMFQRVMYGRLNNPENQNLRDWNFGEKWALVPLVILIFVIGIAATPILRILNPSVNTVMAQTQLTYQSPFAQASAPASPLRSLPTLAAAPVLADRSGTTAAMLTFPSKEIH